MPARISIIEGPDKGAQTVLKTGEVSIGRGAGCQFVVKDEAFDGQLRVYFENGTYWAMNRTEQAVLVWTDNRHAGGQTYSELAPGGRQVWHSGDTIQMTERTYVQLTVEAADEDADDDDTPGGGPVVVTRQRTPEEEKKARDRFRLVTTALCGTVAVVLFMQPAADEGPVVQTRGQVSKKFDEVTADLEALQDNAKYRRSAKIARDLLRDARLDEGCDRGAAAYDEYTQARDELDRAIGDRPTDDRRDDPPPVAADADPALKALQAAREFATERLVVLARNNATRSK